MSNTLKFNRMTRTFYSIIASIVWCVLSIPAFGQSTCSTPTQISGFGVDGDVNANTPASVMGDSWFSSPLYPGTGVGVIGSTAATAIPAMSAAQFNSIIQAGATSQDRNRTYLQRMAYPYLTSINGNKLIDAFAARDNISPDTTSFAGSNKNGDSPALWTIATSAVPNKNDIIDVAGHLRRSGVDNKLWMFANVTKLGTSGDSYTDIEIYRQVPVLNLTTGSLSNTGPAATGGHSAFSFSSTGAIQVAGDILVCLNYNSSSGIASVKVWCDINNLDGNGNGLAWFNALPGRPFNFTGDFITGSASNGYGYAEITSLSPSACLVYSVLNTASSPAGYWGNLSGSGATYSSSLDPEQMVNIAINFSDFGLDLATITGPCSNVFGALMFKTRSSSSFSAELKDICGPFSFGNFSEVQANAGPDTLLNCANPFIHLSGSSISTNATFSWTALSGNIVSGANTFNPIVDQPGVYVLSVQSPLISTCIARDTVVVTLDNTPPTASAGSDASITCANPTVQLAGASNISNAVYSWGAVNGSGIISGGNSITPVVGAGCYVLTVTNPTNGCATSDTVCVAASTQTPSLSILSTNNASCFAACDGSASVGASGLFAPYDYAWSNGTNGQNIGGLCAGTYEVIVTGSNGCTTVANVVIQQPAATISISSASIQNASCSGLNDGSISVIPSGGTAPYSFIWSNGSTTGSSGPVSAGSYTVTITDVNGCSITTPAYIVDQPDQPLSSSNITVSAVSCFGESNGAIDLEVAGGTAPYVYSWSNGSSNQDQTGLSSGSYMVTVTDANGCTFNSTFAISQPAAPLSTSSIIDQNVSCFGGQNGSATVMPAGGTSPYTYSWSNGATSASITALAANTYTVVVTDANGCTVNETVQITQPVQSLASTANAINQVSCYGGSNGSVAVLATGGTAPYDYSWSNGSTASSLTALSQGTYGVTVTDANGCTAVATVTVSEPLAPLTLASVSNVSVACHGDATGQLDLTIVGGTAPYSYQWNNGSVSSSQSGLSNGNYAVTVTDANGCTLNDAFVINQPTAPLAVVSNAVTSVSCNGGFDGSIDITVSGGTSPYVFSWNNGSAGEDLANLNAGTYSCIITDANGCTQQINQSITEPLVALNNTISVSQQVNCFAGNDGSIDLEVNGGTAPYSYTWSNGSVTQDLTGLPSGTYAVVITDVNGCLDSAQVTVSQPQASLALSAIQSVPVSCTGGANGSIDLNVTGGTAPYSFTWSNGSTNEDLVGLTAGTYSVAVVDVNGCTDNLTVTISQPQASLALNANSVSNVDCFGNATGSIDLNVGGGTQPYTYQWSNGSSSEDLSAITAGTYTVSVVDANGCDGTITLTVNEPSIALNNTISVSQQVNCFAGNDGSIDLEVNGGTAPYSYTWSNGSVTQDLSGLTAGAYSVTIVDANGCLNTASITVSQPLDSLTATVVSAQQVDCFGSNNGQIDVTTAGGTAPYAYSWNNGSVTEDLVGLAAGTYSLNIVDANGCVTSLTATISQPTDSLSIQSASSQNVLCYGDTTGSIDLTLFGGTTPYSYSWSNGEITEDVAGLSSGSYSVTITDANGCTTTQAFQVTQPLAQLTVAGSTSVADCINNIGADITVSTNGGTSPYSYQWSTGATSQNLNNVPSATYTVTVTDANGCTAITDFVISNNSFLLVQISSEEICVGDSAVLNVSVSVPATYQWYYNNSPIAGAINNSFVTYAQGFYKCEVNSVCGIIMSDSVEVAVRSLTGASISSNQIICPPETVELVASGGTTYQWSPATYISDPNSSNPTVNPRETTIYTVEVTDDFGCKTTMSVEVAVLCDTMLVPTGFSPNGDGVNDGYEIEGIENYPGNILYIYNRWGNLIYKAKDYNNTWTGESNVAGINYGKKVPSGTYYYILDLNDGQKPRNGYIILRK